MRQPLPSGAHRFALRIRRTVHRLISGGIHRRKSWYAPLWSSQVVDAQPRKRKHAHPSLPTRSLVDSGSAWARCMGSTQLYNLEFVVECLARREVASLVVCTKAKEQRKLLSTLVGNVFWQSCVTRTRARTHAHTHTHTHEAAGHVAMDCEPDHVRMKMAQERGRVVTRATVQGCYLAARCA